MKKSPSMPRRRRSIIAFEMVRLNRDAAEPLHCQLYRQIRNELASGNFTASRLPSSRALAKDLGISRLTVNQAFAKLHAEGFLVTKAGSGTFVADPLPDSFLSASPAATIWNQLQQPVRLSKRVQQIPDPRVGKQLELGAPGSPAGVVLVPGLPAVDEFPIEIWERLRAQVLARKGANLLRYGSHLGDPHLRRTVAAYLSDFRGANCHADQIIIVAGMQQAMAICALAFINRGEAAWLEDPGYHQARRVFAFAGATLVPRPIDQEGMVVRDGSGGPRPRLIYVTPSHQYPMGVTMSLARRRELLAVAQKHDAYILEDDYNAEFRFTGPPLPCLQGLDRAGRVIYAGTMSKILFPSLRLGYLVVPDQLIDSIAKLRSVLDQHSPTIDQATLAAFIEEGFYLSHVRRMRKVYAERRQFFSDEFKKILGEFFELEVTDSGLHALAYFRSVKDVGIIAPLASTLGVKINFLSFHCIEAKLPPALVFGFAAWSRAQIREGLIKISAALKAGRRHRSVVFRPMVSRRPIRKVA